MTSKGILEINDILNDYSKDIQESITETAIAITKKGVSKLKQTSPKKTGSYRKGWRTKKEKGFGYVRCTIHNETDYQLTHLLEKPHATRNGGETTPIVHIAPVEQECIKEYESEVEKIIKDGG